MQFKILLCVVIACSQAYCVASQCMCGPIPGTFCGYQHDKPYPNPDTHVLTGGPNCQDNGLYQCDTPFKQATFLNTCVNCRVGQSKTGTDYCLTGKCMCHNVFSTLCGSRHDIPIRSGDYSITGDSACYENALYQCKDRNQEAVLIELCDKCQTFGTVGPDHC